MKYKYYPTRPVHLTAEFVRAEYQKLLVLVDEAEWSPSPIGWLELFANWNALTAYLDGEGSRINYEYSRHMDDKKLERAEKYYRESIHPVTIEPSHKLIAAFLQSKHRQALTKRYGQQLVSVYESALKPLDPVNTDLIIKEGKLTTEYDKLKGSGQVKVRGELMTLARAGSLVESPDESLRKDAWLANRRWYFKNQAKMAKIFDELVHTRTGMGQNLGYKNFVPLAYQTRGRSDYGRPEIEAFRKFVKEIFVPLNRELSLKHAKSLGKKIIRPWDGYDPRFSLPLGIAPVEHQLAKTQMLFDGLSPELGQHFAYLRQQKLIDLESRPSKHTNPFCTAYTDTGQVAILCSSTGNASDITTLVHESGHAFQGLESSGIEAVDLQWGTADLAEIPSTAMEYLSLSRIEIFFSADDAQKYRNNSVAGFIGMLCYVCLVDEFQHWVYDNPDASPSQRDQKWKELADIYLAPSDYSGYEEYKSLRWYGQMHIFDTPFYYIDYALADVCAMQISMIDAKDHEKAMRTYMELCRLGGTKSFLKAVKHVGLRSPFNESLIKDLAAHAAKQLDLN